MKHFLSLFPDFHTGVSPINNLAATCVSGGNRVPCPELGGVFAVVVGIVLFVLLVLCILTIVGMWKVFEKAGEKGWKSIIPIYNIVIMLRIIKEPWWLLLFYFVPVASIVVSIVVVYKISQAFGKGAGFTIGLIFLPFVFYPILGFGKATYQLGGDMGGTPGATPLKAV